MGPSDRRRVRTAQEKAALLAEVDAEGGKVRLVGRRHNIPESLLYNWRSVRKAAAVAMGAPENFEFISAGIIDDPVSSSMSIAVPAAPDREPSLTMSLATVNLSMDITALRDFALACQGELRVPL